jgi:hypothetical protein
MRVEDVLDELAKAATDRSRSEQVGDTARHLLAEFARLFAATAARVRQVDLAESDAAERARVAAEAAEAAAAAAAANVPFDPAKHSIQEVKAHLLVSDAAERDRVLSAERKGRARVTILDDVDVAAAKGA